VSDPGTYLITGGAGGIGQAVARRLVADGHHVVLADRDEAAVMAAAGVLRGATGIPVDLSDAGACLTLVAQAAAAADPPLRGAVTCAGVLGSFAPSAHTAEQWDDVLAVNARASYLVADATARTVAASGRTGSVVLYSSGAARRAFGIPAYSASKGAVEAVARELSLTWAPQGVRVNVIAPGPVNTEMLGDARSDPALMSAIVARIPLGRVAEPEELAATTTFLLGDDASYITGITLDVDGGFTSH
jgi:NAD(P)-dependent dehydrogenase (short-subunit alcohol dehydrogenase family)